jgi:hypothetical protein
MIHQLKFFNELFLVHRFAILVKFCHLFNLIVNSTSFRWSHVLERQKAEHPRLFFTIIAALTDWDFARNLLCSVALHLLFSKSNWISILWFDVWFGLWHYLSFIVLLVFFRTLIPFRLRWFGNFPLNSSVWATPPVVIFKPIKLNHITRLWGTLTITPFNDLKVRIEFNLNWSKIFF